MKLRFFLLVAFTIVSLPFTQRANALSIACNPEDEGKFIDSAIKEGVYVLEGEVKTAKPLTRTDINSGPQDSNVKVEFLISKIYRNNRELPVFEGDEIDFRGTRDTWAAPEGTGPFQAGYKMLVVLELNDGALQLTDHDLYCGTTVSVINLESEYNIDEYKEFLEDIKEYPVLFTVEKFIKPDSDSNTSGALLLSFGIVIGVSAGFTGAMLMQKNKKK